MTLTMGVAIVKLLIGEAKEFYDWLQQRHGDKIPSWNDLLKENEDLQAKIDKEKGDGA